MLGLRMMAAGALALGLAGGLAVGGKAVGRALAEDAHAAQGPAAQAPSGQERAAEEAAAEARAAEAPELSSLYRGFRDYCMMRAADPNDALREYCRANHIARVTIESSVGGGAGRPTVSVDALRASLSLVEDRVLDTLEYQGAFGQDWAVEISERGVPETGCYIPWHGCVVEYYLTAEEWLALARIIRFGYALEDCMMVGQPSGEGYSLGVSPDMDSLRRAFDDLVYPGAFDETARVVCFMDPGEGLDVKLEMAPQAFTPRIRLAAIPILSSEAFNPAPWIAECGWGPSPAARICGMWAVCGDVPLFMPPDLLHR